MSFTEDLIGTLAEVLMTVFIMNLFSQQYLRHKVRLAAAIVSIALIVSCLDLLELSITTILNFVVEVIVFRLIAKQHIFRVLFEVIFASAIMLSIEYVLAVIFYKIQGIESLDFANRCIQLAIGLIICGLAGGNRSLQIRVYTFYKRYQEEIYFISVTLFSFCAISLYLWKSDSHTILNQSPIISVYTAIWFSLSVFLLKKLIENRKQRENILLHEQYMETTENLLDSLYSEKHDFNKHLQAIQGLCQYGDQQAASEIERYIGELRSKELDKKKSTVSISTGNGVVNALLYSKAKEAEKRNIQFYYVPGGSFPDFPCEPYEMVQILGNLLDNAFEYLEGLEETERVVTLVMDEWEGKRRIETRNTCHLEKSFTAGISSKSNCSTKSGERRGYGLRNIKTIVLKHHGKLRIFQEGDQFIVEVLF
ncbi:GHKL domain-containing protein [Aminipila butyrica]|uniref:GHKL domain-containing protein n=1 Tax=Aminipila butyrica TaxID=433296 RepID=A0A858BSZ5_9FIRM|nr:GHKL domain-containing protein [Aminipila butyrica]QIB68482.1 GHKL domain-containing protein [Aminipila butyrica]